MIAEKNQDKDMENRKRVTTVYVSEKHLKLLRERYGNISQFLNEIIEYHARGLPASSVSYLQEIDQKKRKYKEEIEEIEKDVNSEIEFWQNTIEKLQKGISFCKNRIQQLEKKKNERIGIKKNEVEILQKKEEELRKEMLAAEEQEKRRQAQAQAEEDKRKEETMKLKTKWLHKIVELVLDHYNPRTNFIEIDEVKVPLSQYLDQRIDALMKKFDLGINEIFNEIEKIEINGRKLSDYNWWEEYKRKKTAIQQ